MTFARIAIAIIVAFALIHAVLFWRHGHEGLLARSAEFAISTLDRGSQAALALNTAPDLLPLLSSPAFRLRIVNAPGVEGTRWRHTEAIRQRVLDHISDPSLDSPPRFNADTVIDFTELRGRPTMLAWIPMPTGDSEPNIAPAQWLEVSARPALTRQAERMRGAAVTTMLVLAVLITLLWATRRITRHLPRFASAAEALARGERIALPENGPKDVRRLAQTFNDMSSRIQQAAADRSQMLGALGHDLRSAITRLVLRVEGITEEPQRAAAQRDLADMQSLLEQSISFARDEHATEGYDQIDVASLLQTAVDDASETGSDASYRGPDQFTATVQPLGLRRAVDNLLSNAVRYGDRARVRLHAGDEVIIDVSDDGPGIDPADQGRVTQAFYRLEPSRNRGSGGAGLGLAIVAGVARRHGGALTFSNSTEGFTARLTLPKAPTNDQLP